MILKNLKHREVRPGDILIWLCDVELGDRPRYDLVISVIMNGEHVYYWLVELSALKLWSSPGTPMYTTIRPHVLRVKP